MRKKARFSALIIGLGRFGSATAQRLVSLGWDVVGVDLNPAVIAEMQDELEHVVQLDASDEEALATLGIPDFDVCIVSRGESVESGILLVLNLQHLEAKKIVAKAASTYHARILRRLGIEDIIFPERDAGDRLAERLHAPHLSQSLELTDDRELAVIQVPRGRTGSTLHSWRATQSPSLEILAHLTKDGRPLTTDRFAPLSPGEILIVTGTSDDILALGE